MLDKLYKIRFNNQKERDKIWKILTSNFFQKYINNNDTVLDIPCGYGEFINNISCKNKFAIDINDNKNYLTSSVVFQSASSTNIPLKDNSIDKIFVSNFFEHLEKNDILKTISEFKRVLRKNGEVLILQPNIRYCYKDYWMFFDHITPIDDRALEEVFCLHDFRLKYKINRFLPYTTKSKLPSYSFLIKIYLKLPLVWHFLGKQSFLIFKK